MSIVRLLGLSNEMLLFPWNMAYIVIVLLLVYKSTYALYVYNNGVKISYSFSFNKQCHNTDDRFWMNTGLALPECVTQCALRAHCISMNYRRQYLLCELFSTAANEGTPVRGGCVHINASEIEIVEVYVLCYLYLKRHTIRRMELFSMFLGMHFPITVTLYNLFPYRGTNSPIIKAHVWDNTCIVNKYARNSFRSDIKYGRLKRKIIFRLVIRTARSILIKLGNDHRGNW